MNGTRTQVLPKNMSRGKWLKGTKCALAEVDGYDVKKAVARALEAFIEEFGDEGLNPDLEITVVFSSFSTIAEVTLGTDRGYAKPVRSLAVLAEEMRS